MASDKTRGGSKGGVRVLCLVTSLLLSAGLAEEFTWVITGQSGNPLQGLTVCLDNTCFEPPTGANGVVTVQAEPDTWYLLRLFFGNELFFTDDLFVTRAIAFDGTVVKINSP